MSYILSPINATIAALRDWWKQGRMNLTQFAEFGSAKRDNYFEKKTEE